MSDIRLNNLIFDRGIDTITYARQEAASTMPERGDAPPPDIGTRAQLDLLLQTSSMDSRLDQALRPELKHRDLLLPGRFNEALGNALTQLRDAAQGGEATDQSRVLNRAVRLLSEESNLRDLVQMYRSALYQG
ncbi:hypothetical protein [Acidovorax sp. CCYZU-2555]|uniref:type III secretion apparatus assembly protein SctX n=1 Tax=Acidovorax sp. CCYZU-2555 TaxID=2835042 RepID=UPI001BCBC638|nr:hypothetical protein [Acidovorax sp. CCYZU-2555]MBS7777603.1 hypothetical protein [Acidovorax sp. CCYZU-2555]